MSADEPPEERCPNCGMVLLAGEQPCLPGEPWDTLRRIAILAAEIDALTREPHGS